MSFFFPIKRQDPVSYERDHTALENYLNRADDEWSDMSLLNGWVNYGGAYATAQYRKTIEGLIVVQGVIKSGTTAAATQIASLPSGYRPSATLILPVASQAGGYADCAMQSDGSLKAGVGWSAGSTSFNFSFHAGW